MMKILRNPFMSVNFAFFSLARSLVRLVCISRYDSIKKSEDDIFVFFLKTARLL